MRIRSKIFTVLVLVATMMMLSATAALAAAPKFHSTASDVNSAGALVVSWDERGLGNENVDYTVTADVSAVFACFNRGGNHPEAANKETINDDVSVSGSFEPRNGRIVASLTTAAPSAGDFSCPSGQRLVLASASYTNIVLTDTTNGVSTSVPDASETFFDV